MQCEDRNEDTISNLELKNGIVDAAMSRPFGLPSGNKHTRVKVLRVKLL